MANKYSPNDLNRRCKIGSFKTTKTKSGGSKQELDTDTSVTVWYGAKTRSLALQLGLSAIEKDDFEIVVRHNTQYIDMGVVMIGTDLYKIINVSPDDSAKLVTYDFITLRKVTKGT